MIRRVAATGPAVCGLLLAALAAQTPPIPVPPPDAPPAEAPATPTLVSQLQQVVRRDLDAEQRRAVAEAILARGGDAPTQLFETLRNTLAERRKTLAKDIERHLRGVQKAAPAVLRKLQGRGNDERVKALRDQAHAITAAPGLSKEQIHAEFDPLVEELRTRCTVTLAQILAADAALRARDAELRATGADLRVLYDLHLLAMHAADASEEGRRRIDRLGQDAEPIDVAAALDADLDVALLAAVCASPKDQKVLQTNLDLRAATDREEWLGTFHLNRYRLLLGLPLLAIDRNLGDAARGHADDMAKLGFFSHESPVPGKHSFGERAAQAGTSASAENIATGASTGEGAIRMWYYSPGHHKNMFGGHARTGLGRSGTLWTQMFG